VVLEFSIIFWAFERANVASLGYDIEDFNKRGVVAALVV
jgi:hypothetical protein